MHKVLAHNLSLDTYYKILSAFQNQLYTNWVSIFDILQDVVSWKGDLITFLQYFTGFHDIFSHSK